MRIGSLFTGYGGLDLAVMDVLDATVAWHAEIEPAALTVLDAHYPDVPNLGDVTTVDWSTVAPVDVLTGGYPCQPFSQAGKRKGTDDERALWPYVKECIRVVRPTITVLENVPGHVTLGLDVVMSDLADLGLSARWGVVSAADAGAPHRRSRLFIVVADPDEIRRVVMAQPDRTLGQERVRQGLLLPHSGMGTDSRMLAAIHGPRRAATLAQRAETVGRTAPDHVVTDESGAPVLNPVFTEWLMGLPEGWVTGHGLSAPECLALLGNGVVPQQGALALDLLGVTP